MNAFPVKIARKLIPAIALLSLSTYAHADCPALSAIYREAEMQMATLFVEGTVRPNIASLISEQMELQSAQIAIQFMRDQRCKLPEFPPDHTHYLPPALACITAMQKLERSKTKEQEAKTTLACDRAKWVATVLTWEAHRPAGVSP